MQTITLKALDEGLQLLPVRQTLFVRIPLKYRFGQRRNTRVYTQHLSVPGG